MFLIQKTKENVDSEKRGQEPNRKCYLVIRHERNIKVVF